MNKKNIVSVVVLLAIVIVGVYYLNNKKVNMNTDTNKASAAGAVEQNEVAKSAEVGDVIIVHYAGTLPDGTKFDSSYDRGEPFGFILGKGMVIKGWDEGLLGAKKGDKKHLVISGDKAYGDQEIKGADGKVLIPKNATLVFDLEVLEVVSKAQVEEMMKAQAEAAGTSTLKE